MSWAQKKSDQIWVPDFCRAWNGKTIGSSLTFGSAPAGDRYIGYLGTESGTPCHL